MRYVGRSADQNQQKKRALEENRLRDEACKELEKLEDLIERLENIAGAAMARIHASDDAAPDEADSYADDLEESDDPKTTLKGLSPTLAAWTAQSLRDRYRRRQETLAVDIQSELEVRNFGSLRLSLTRLAELLPPKSRECF